MNVTILVISATQLSFKRLDLLYWQNITVCMGIKPGFSDAQKLLIFRGLHHNQFYLKIKRYSTINNYIVLGLLCLFYWL